jgi:hypothetical protein
LPWVGSELVVIVPPRSGMSKRYILGRRPPDRLSTCLTTH